jgi:hypothetical protein
MRLLWIAVALPLLASVAAAQPRESWIADARSGCSAWNPYPTEGESITWSGGCRDGHLDGRGVLEWHYDGRVVERYDGEFRDGRQVGHGTYDNGVDGRHYEGDFRAGRLTGRGVMTWRDGARYDGDFVDGRAHGEGTYLDARGNRFTGPWTDGCFRKGDQRAGVGVELETCR